MKTISKRQRAPKYALTPLFVTTVNAVSAKSHICAIIDQNMETSRLVQLDIAIQNNKTKARIQQLICRSLFLYIAVSFVQINLPASTFASERSYTVINLMPEYFEFWDEARDLSAENRIALFKSSMMKNHPEVFNANVVRLLGDEDAEERLTKHLGFYLEQMELRLDHIRQLSAQAGAGFNQIESSFLVLFDDFYYTGEIYFMPSLLYFDGATRTIKG